MIWPYKLNLGGILGLFKFAIKVMMTHNHHNRGPGEKESKDGTNYDSKYLAIFHSFKLRRISIYISQITATHSTA